MPEQHENARHVRLRIRGHVQGVGFRYSTRKTAAALGVDVVAENLDDGSVLIEARGPTNAVDKLVEWARVGPRAAQVESLELEDLADSSGPIA